MNDKDAATGKALFRYQVISPLLALDLSRGEKGHLYEELAHKEWPVGPGETVKVSKETVRRWLRLYRTGGFEALKDRSRPSGTKGTLPPEVIETACRLKREVPQRSLDRIIAIMEDLEMVAPGLVRRSTLHRALQAKDLSGRSAMGPKSHDLARWQADYANDLWQADLLEGPWLPDPNLPGKKRKTRLYAFIDDASRLLLAGRFFFTAALPALELVFKRALQKFGIPRKVYYDNGWVFRSIHMKQICAEIGIHRPIHTRPYRPMGHGKIEAFNRFCVSNFIAEVSASSITTLAELNQAFIAWVETDYNRRRHQELGTTPRDRWFADLSRVRFADEEKLRVAFLWQESRHADKCGIIRLFNLAYQASAALAGKKVHIRYDPEHLDAIEVWTNGIFRERVKPARMKPHRPPPAPAPPAPSTDEVTDKTDYLGWLTRRYRKQLEEGLGPDDPRVETLIEVFRTRLDPDVFNEEEIRRFHFRYAPLNPDEVARKLDDFLAAHPHNLHLSVYLEALRGGEGS